MTRIAVLADIHGNIPALNAVLTDIRSQNVDEVISAGDLVGRGPDGSAVIERIRSENIRSVRGNHEDYLISFIRREVPEEWLVIDEWSCQRWMANELTEEAYRFIDALPFTMTSQLEPSMRIVHGSPRSYHEGIGPWTSKDVMQNHLNSVDEPLLICGHTHRPGEWKLEGGTIVNVGSVGMPFNRDTRAQYTIFEYEDSWNVEFVQVEYDVQEVLNIHESSGFLAEGGVTALLLGLELQGATPYLVPFLKWAEVLEKRPLDSELAEFLEFHDPSLSMRAQYERLMELKKPGV